MTKIFKLEIMKLKGLSLMWIVTMAPMFMVLQGALNFLRYYDLFTNKGQNIWKQIFIQSNVFYSFTLLPILITIIMIGTARVENNNGGWKYLLSLPVQRNKIYAAKFFIGFLLTLINVLVFIMSVFAAGKLAGAPGAIPYDTIVVKPLMAFASSLFLRGCVFMAKILLCDDDRELRELLIKYLRSEGHDVSSAGDGLTSLKLALEDDFDLILLDVMMPFMDGFEVLRRLREKSAVPVILLTAKDEDVNKVLGLGIGADDDITKPFSLDEVGARVKALLRRVYYYAEVKREDDVLKSGELVMNLESCRVTLSAGK